MDMTSREPQFARGIPDDVSVLSPKERQRKPPPKMVPFRSTPEFIAEIDSAAAELGLSRNEAMSQLLRFALDAHRKDQPKRTKK